MDGGSLWAINSFSWEVKQTSLGHISTVSVSAPTVKNVGSCEVEVYSQISLCSSKKREWTPYTFIKETSWQRLIFEAQNVFARYVLSSETVNFRICCLSEEKEDKSMRKANAFVCIEVLGIRFKILLFSYSDIDYSVCFIQDVIKKILLLLLLTLVCIFFWFNLIATS